MRRCCIFFFRTNTVLSGRKDILGKVETVDCCGVVGVQRAFRASLFNSRSVSCRSTHRCITNIALIPCYGYAMGIPAIPTSDAPICLLPSVFYFHPHSLYHDHKHFPFYPQISFFTSLSSLPPFLPPFLLIRQLIHETSELIEGHVGSRDKLGQICIFSVFMAMGQIARSKCSPPPPLHECFFYV